MGALDAAVRAGKARYVGISSYGPERTIEAARILRELGTPLLIHQPSYSMLNRWIEPELLDVLAREGVGAIVFSPLAQGMLTDRYLDGVPEDSRVRRGNYFSADMLSEQNLEHVRALNEIAKRRGQSLAQLAIAWALRDDRVTSGGGGGGPGTPPGPERAPRHPRHVGAARREQRQPARAERRRAAARRLRRRRAR